MEFLTEAKQWYQTLQGVQKRPAVFTPDILEHIAGITIEKFFMAMLDSCHLLPENHTMTDFIRASSGLIPLDDNLKAVLLEMDNQQQLCLVALVKHEPPDTATVRRYLGAVDAVVALSEKHFARNGLKQHK